ncbi:MAG TPA: hypothetical protein DCQ64_26180 [Candidatus Rokubacteria bacterium]|nr:hypothetical protein [Candidatus Rokubacteria bacterium]
MIQITLRTADYRGDHAADVLVAYEAIPGETVEALVARLIGQRGPYANPEHEVIEIRVTAAEGR